MNASMFALLRRKCRGFLKDERGATAIFVAAGAIAFVGIVGISVDAARGYLVQSRLSSALDAAGLAGARMMFSPDRDAEILKYFNANFPQGYLGANVTPPSPPPVVPGQTALSLTASASIETTLTKVLGFDTLQVSAATEVTRSTPSLDVVLSVDMSGSMDSNLGGLTRLQHAVVAAKLMTDILFNAPNVLDLNVGLVPWSSKVNVTSNGVAFNPAATTTVPVQNFVNPITGAAQNVVYMANNSPVPLLSPPPAREPFTDSNGNGIHNSSEPYTDVNGNGVFDDDWHGCVYARYRDDGNTSNDADIDVGPLFGLGGKDWPAWEVVDGRGERDTNNTCTMDPGFCVPCLNQGITPLQSTQAAIDAEIDNLTNPIGSTEIINGLAWAWRVLVPEAPYTEAPPDPNFQRIKAIVLLTDGAYSGWPNDSYKDAWRTSPAPSSLTFAYDRLRDLATKIKATGVRIYTIQFTTTSGAQLMKDVATADFPPYYNAPSTGAELSSVFQQIADDLVELHISQ